MAQDYTMKIPQSMRDFHGHILGALSASFLPSDCNRWRSRRSREKTLLLVTHHIHEIPPEVERVVLLKQGTILQDGKKRSILTETNLSQLFDCPVSLAQANG
jgi:iron complex transport system ATP-binding protein